MRWSSSKLAVGFLPRRSSFSRSSLEALLTRRDSLNLEITLTNLSFIGCQEDGDLGVHSFTPITSS